MHIASLKLVPHPMWVYYAGKPIENAVFYCLNISFAGPSQVIFTFSKLLEKAALERYHNLEIIIIIIQASLDSRKLTHCQAETFVKTKEYAL